jgi:poly-D-alanine transfer protein DltD
MTDNALAADYASVQTTNFRFGINLTFYGKREKKKEKQEEEKQKMEETEASMNHNF